MKRFTDWLMRNRKPVGYTIGTLNLAVAANFGLQGYTGLAVLWIVLAFFAFHDAYEAK